LKINPKAALFFGIFGTSFSSILVKYASAPSLITAVYRLGFTVLFMLLFVLAKHREELKKLDYKSILYCSISGVFLALHFSFWFESLKHTSVASSTLLVNTEVIFTALGFVLFMKGKIPIAGFISIAITFLGSILIALADNGGGHGALYGDLLALLGAVFVAVYTLIGKMQRKHLSTVIYTFLVYTACFFTLIIMALASRTPILGYGKKEIMIGLLLSVFCTLLGHSVYSWSLRYITPSYVSACKLCEPLFATIMAILIYSEIPVMMQVIGGVIIIVGVILYTKYEKINTQ
jgi:drug/metabolite transporter (DMT)-like permease